MTQRNAHQYLKKVYLTTKNDSYRQALSVALTALRPAGRKQLDVVINSLKLRLENNEENGVVYIPKFAVEEMIKRLEVLRND